MATAISDVGDIFLPPNHFREQGIQFPCCTGCVGPSKSQVITHISFRGGKLPHGAGKGRKLNWHFLHVSGRYMFLITQFCANLQFAVLGSFSLVSNQTHQNYSEVTAGNNTSFLLLQIKRRAQAGQETHCCNRTWLTLMWKQLHSLIYFLARKQGICFQKGKGLWDVSWFFVIRSVPLSMIYRSISGPGGLRAPSSSPENLKALLCSWSIANIYIWQSNVEEPGPALSLDPVYVLTGFIARPGHGVQGAPGIAFPKVSLLPFPDFHTGITSTSVSPSVLSRLEACAQSYQEKKNKTLAVVQSPSQAS